MCDVQNLVLSLDDKRISFLLKKILELGGNRVRFVILFGSRAEGYARDSSDVDLAVYYDGDRSERYLFLKRLLEYFDESIDIHTFQDLPLVLKSKILRDGRVLYYDDFDFLFGVANRVRLEYEDFKHRLKLILS